MATRITLSLPENVAANLRVEARRRGTTLSAVVAGALVEHLGLEANERRTLPFESLGDADDDRLSERVDQILATEWVVSPARPR